MGTSSSISIENFDGSIDTIYCNFDGYLEHNGKILIENYSDADLVCELIDHGDLSFLGAKIYPTGKHTSKNPEDNVCIFYGRDMGRSNTNSVHYNNIYDYLENVKGNYHYNYCFNEAANKWVLVEKESILDLENVLLNKKIIEPKKPQETIDDEELVESSGIKSYLNEDLLVKFIDNFHKRIKTRYNGDGRDKDIAFGMEIVIVELEDLLNAS